MHNYQYGRNKPYAGRSVNWAHPLTKGLVWLALPDSNNRHELIRAGKSTLYASGEFTGKTTIGPGVKSTSTTNGGIYYPWSTMLESIINDFTILVYANLTSVTTWSHLLDIPYNSNWSSPYSCLRLNEFNGTGMLGASFNSGGNLVNGVSGLATVAATDGLTLYGVTRTGNSMSFYKGGMFVDTIAPGNAGSVDFGNKREVSLLNRNSGDAGEGAAGTLTMAAIYNRVLSDMEIREIYLKPYNLIAPRMIYGL